MTTDSLKTVGRSYPREDAPEGVSGAAIYVDDLNPPGVLYGAVLRAGRPHARILRIDTSKAERMKGVACVLTGRDVPRFVPEETAGARRDQIQITVGVQISGRECGQTGRER